MYVRYSTRMERTEGHSSIKAGISARQSHGKETSVEDQVRAGAHRCALLGAEVVKVYRDKVSASRFGTKPRDEWPLLVEDVKAGKLDLVWCWDASRADRDPVSWFPFLAACRDRGVRIYLERDRHTYDLTIPRDWKTLADSGVDAAYESEIKSVDVRRGIAGAAMAGKGHGSPTYGLRRVYDQTDRRKFTDEPDENAPIAREIIEKIARQVPIVAIERDLNERGIPSPSGGRWHRNTIRAIGRNPAYIAKRRHNGAIYDANWPPLVTTEVWEAAQIVLDDPDRKRSAPGSLRWLLSYIALGECRSPLKAAPRYGDGRRPRYQCLDDGCTNIEAASLDEYVTRVVLRRLAQIDARSLFAAGDESAHAAREELARLEGRLREARESFLGPDGISAASLAMLERSLEPKIAEARKRAESATMPAALLELLGEDFDEDVARPRWEALSVPARRAVIEKLNLEIVVSKSTRRLSRWATEDERLEQAHERTKITSRSV